MTNVNHVLYGTFLDVEHSTDFLILADIKSLRSLTMHRLEVKHGESCYRLWSALCLQLVGCKNVHRDLNLSKQAH